MNDAPGIEPIPPERFGRYTLVARLAVGGMGEVFLARSGMGPGLQQLVVLKRIRLELAADPQFQQRFLSEARVLLQLAHGAVTKVHDVGDVEGRSFIALEFVDGKDLRAVIARAAEVGQRVPPALAIQIVLRVLDALAYAHRKKGDDEKELQLVHRDISPQNVLVSYDGEVKVIDFGLAKSVLSVQRTHPSVILGKLLYMAPEIAKHDMLDRRADLFATGVMLHELLAGRHELADKKPGEVMLRVVTPRFRPLEGEVPDLPPGTDAALARALEPDPDQRFRTAEEMRGAFIPLAVGAGSDLSPEPVGAYLRELFAEAYGAERPLLRQLRTGEADPVTARAVEVDALRATARDGSRTAPFPIIGAGMVKHSPGTGPTLIPEAATPVPVDPTFVGTAPSPGGAQAFGPSLDSAEFVFGGGPRLMDVPTLPPGELSARPASETARQQLPWDAPNGGPGGSRLRHEPITDASLPAAERAAAPALAGPAEAEQPITDPPSAAPDPQYLADTHIQAALPDPEAPSSSLPPPPPPPLPPAQGATIRVRTGGLPVYAPLAPEPPAPASRVRPGTGNIPVLVPLDARGPPSGPGRTRGASGGIPVLTPLAEAPTVARAPRPPSAGPAVLAPAVDDLPLSDKPQPRAPAVGLAPPTLDAPQGLAGERPASPSKATSKRRRETWPLVVGILLGLVVAGGMAAGVLWYLHHRH